MLGGGVVSARVPGIAAQQSLNAEPPPFHDTVFRQCFAGVVGTGGSKSAGRRFQRADQVLIAMYQLNHDSAHLLSTRLNSIFKLPICTPPSWGSLRLSITTRSSPHNLMLCWRNASLMTLFMRFRSVARASVFLPTII